MTKTPPHEKLNPVVKEQTKESSRQTMTEEMLRQRVAQLQHIADNLPVMFSYINKVQEYVFANRQFQESFSSESVIGRKIDEVLSRDTYERIKPKIEAVLAGKEVTYERVGLTDVGDKRYFRTSYRPDWDESGDVIGFFALLYDITEMKEAEDALRESEERLRVAGQVSYDLIYEWNIKEDTLEWFGDIDNMLGYHPHEIPRTIQGWVNLIHPEDAAILKNAVERHRASSEPISYEYKVRHKDGSWRYWSDNALPLIDHEGHPSKWIGVCTDITEQKASERALKESEEKYRQLFELESDAIFLIENETGHILEANPKASRLYGYSREELLRKKNTDLSAEPDKTRNATHIGRVRIPLRYHRKKDGTVFPVEITATHFAWQERDVHIAAIRDITFRVEAEEEKRRLQAQLQHAQKLEAIGTLAGGIAHDFNNLLMGIQGNASLMLLDTDSEEPHYEKLKNIEQYIQNGAELTRQLLGFARGGKYEVKPTDINALVERTSTMFSRTKREIAVHSKYQQEVWVVEVDPGQMEQVLLNLYVNAWQAMPSGGDLFLETENVTLGEDDVKPFDLHPGRYVRLSVGDNGTGMEENIRERIFDPFFTTKEMGRGTGLGLASVYGIVKNHGGFIQVHSQKGEGTTFDIYLPASEKQAVKEIESPETFLGGTEGILLVDDEVMILQVGKELLERMGYGVFTAASGREAIDIYKKNADKIDMVILDMVMPGMSGSDTFDCFKEMEPNIKLLLSSGYSLDGQAKEILNRGCHGFIQKPFDIKELSKKIREIFD